MKRRIRGRRDRGGHLTPDIYPYPPADRYRLTAPDGRILLSAGTEQECWAMLHRIQSVSVLGALRWQGYAMAPIVDEDPRASGEERCGCCQHKAPATICGDCQRARTVREEDGP